ncbi:hypothetical protein MMC29_005577 [Sticta canariensis]|nr:hypothetical protein [Sticta canariensis]
MDCSQLPAHRLSPFTSTVYEQTWNELNYWNAEHVPSEIAPHQLDFVHGESSGPYQQPPPTPRQHEEPVDGYQPAFPQGDVPESLKYEAVTFEHYRPILPPQSLAESIITTDKAEPQTPVCGVYCPEIQKPRPKEKSGSLNLKFECPRCSTRFSRRYSVKSHFPSCIERYGNPDALKWNEHASAKGYQPRKRNRYNIFRSLSARGKKNGSRRKHG